MKITGIKEIAKESKTLNNNLRSRLQIQIDSNAKLHCYKCYSNDYFRNDHFITLGWIYNKMSMKEIKIWIMEKIQENISSDHVYNDFGKIIHIEKMTF